MIPFDPPRSADPEPAYRLEAQVGFILRQVSQRHAAIFAQGIDGVVTTTQWAALAKLAEAGSLSQNRLGRLIVMDAATVKGVVDRLTQRGLVQTSLDPDDGRRRLVSLTRAGAALVEQLLPQALVISADTLAPLDPAEREAFTRLLLKLR